PTCASALLTSSRARSRSSRAATGNAQSMMAGIGPSPRTWTPPRDHRHCRAACARTTRTQEAIWPPARGPARAAGRLAGDLADHFGRCPDRMGDHARGYRVLFGDLSVLLLG